MDISRRDFIKYLTVIGISSTSAYVLLSNLGCTQESEAPRLQPPPVTDKPYMSVTRGQVPAQLVETAIASLGGIERFVKPGDDVIIKPNMCVAYRTYEYAATTNPEVVGTLVNLCVNSGAKRVRVMDNPFGGSAEEAYENSGIGEAVRNAGGEMELMAKMKYSDYSIPYGRDITSWSFYRDIVEADVLINVPIAKHHGNTRLTLGMKNLIGITGDMGGLHENLAQRIADINTLIRPDLNIVDAIRILTNNGPQGGSLSDVKLTNTIIASPDIVAADSYAATLFNLTGVDIPYVRIGSEMGIGINDFDSIWIDEINVDS